LLQLVDDVAAVVAAATEVAENSLYAFVDTSDEAAFDASTAASDGAGGWFRADVGFRGVVDGRFILTVPRALAVRLGVAFAGVESPTDLAEGEVADFVGEVTNMFCGAWLTRAVRKQAFDLTPPRVQATPRSGLVGSAPPTDGRGRRLYLAIDDTPIAIEIQCEAVAGTREAAGSAR
jgi:CheY-specific phosphatase CheX